LPAALARVVFRGKPQSGKYRKLNGITSFTHDSHAPDLHDRFEDRAFSKPVKMHLCRKRDDWFGLLISG